MIGRGRIYLGDCLEVMKGIPTAGIDMVLAIESMSRQGHGCPDAGRERRHNAPREGERGAEREAGRERTAPARIFL